MSTKDFGSIVTVGEFTGDLRALLTRWKFLGRTIDTGHLADMMVATLRSDPSIVAPDIVTWAPTSDRRRRERGYDQAELLARAVSRRMRLPCRSLLRRSHGDAQTGRSRVERMDRGPRFSARPTTRATRVMVIDDVVTTGSTLRSAADALMMAGYCGVTLVALARTPSHSGTRSTA